MQTSHKDHAGGNIIPWVCFHRVLGICGVSSMVGVFDFSLLWYACICICICITIYRHRYFGNTFLYQPLTAWPCWRSSDAYPVVRGLRQECVIWSLESMMRVVLDGPFLFAAVGPPRIETLKGNLRSVWCEFRGGATDVGGCLFGTLQQSPVPLRNHLTPSTPQLNN